MAITRWPSDVFFHRNLPPAYPNWAYALTWKGSIHYRTRFNNAIYELRIPGLARLNGQLNRFALASYPSDHWAVCLERFEFTGTTHQRRKQRQQILYDLPATLLLAQL